MYARNWFRIFRGNEIRAITVTIYFPIFYSTLYRLNDLCTKNWILLPLLNDPAFYCSYQSICILFFTTSFRLDRFVWLKLKRQIVWADDQSDLIIGQVSGRKCSIQNRCKLIFIGRDNITSYWKPGHTECLQLYVESHRSSFCLNTKMKAKAFELTFFSTLIASDD